MLYRSICLTGVCLLVFVAETRPDYLIYRVPNTRLAFKLQGRVEVHPDRIVSY